MGILLLAELCLEDGLLLLQQAEGLSRGGQQQLGVRTETNIWNTAFKNVSLSLRWLFQTVSLTANVVLTSEADGLLHLHPLRAWHGHQRPLLPPHQAHGDNITDRILPSLHSDHTAEREKPESCQPFPPSTSAEVLRVCVPPLQVSRVNGFVADGTLGPAAFAQRQVVQHARPAEDVSAAGDACCHRGVQADGTRRHLMAIDALERNTSRQSVNASRQLYIPVNHWKVGLSQSV